MIRAYITGFVLGAMVVDVQAYQAWARTRHLANHTVDVEVSAGGAFTPSLVNIVATDSVRFTNLDWRQSIAEVASNVGEPCSNFEPYTENGGVTGPRAEHTPAGILARTSTGSAGPGIVDPCADPETCCDNDTDPVVVGTKAYCNVQDGVLPGALPREMWAYSELAGTILVLDANEIRPTNDPDYVDWDWDILDEHLNMAMFHGKKIIIALRYGQEGTPQWICDDNDGPVTCFNVEDNNSTRFDEDSTNCGDEWLMPSVGDPDFLTHMQQTWAGIGSHVKSKSGWRLAVGGVQGVGVNNVSGEFKWPHSCSDFDHDGILDTINGDQCTCNLLNAAQAGWSDDALAAHVDAVNDYMPTAFWPGIAMLNPIIQGGYGKIEPGVDGNPSTNFEGDSLCAAGTEPPCTAANMICPSCGATPAIAASNDNQLTGSIAQLEAMIDLTQDTDEPVAWWPHYGGGRVGTEDEERPAPSLCSWMGDPDDTPSDPPTCLLVDLVANDVTQQAQCLNSWAVSTTLVEPTPFLNAFQCNNRGNGIDSPEDYESVLWHVMCGSNATQMQFYADMMWENHEINGSGGDMDAAREACGSGYDPQFCGTGYSKSATVWNAEFRDRRDNAIFSDRFGKAYPNNYSWETSDDWAASTVYATVPSRAGEDGLGCDLLTINIQ